MLRSPSLITRRFYCSSSKMNFTNFYIFCKYFFGCLATFPRQCGLVKKYLNPNQKVKKRALEITTAHHIHSVLPPVPIIVCAGLELVSEEQRKSTQRILYLSNYVTEHGMYQVVNSKQNLRAKRTISDRAKTAGASKKLY